MTDFFLRSLPGALQVNPRHREAAHASRDRILRFMRSQHFDREFLDVALDNAREVSRRFGLLLFSEDDDPLLLSGEPSCPTSSTPPRRLEEPLVVLARRSRRSACCWILSAPSSRLGAADGVIVAYNPSP